MILRELLFFSVGEAPYLRREINGRFRNVLRVSAIRCFKPAGWYLKYYAQAALCVLYAACAYTYVCSALAVQGKEVRIHDGK